MVEPLSSKKAFHTALVICPPPSLWPQIQKIRQAHDSAYDRWMPHINLAFPFVQPKEFDNVFLLLQKNFQNLQPFNLKFENLGIFKHAKKGVLWAKPQTDNDELQEVEKMILESLPFCDDLIKKSDDGKFHPHLTLAQFDLHKIESMLTSFQQKWEAISFLVTEIYMIERTSQTTPFYVKQTIKLGSEGDYAKEINEEMKKLEKGFYQTEKF